MHEFLETISVIDMLAGDEFIWLNSELTDLLEFACLNGSHAIQRLIKIMIKDRNAFLPISIEYFGVENLHMVDTHCYQEFISDHLNWYSKPDFQKSIF